MRTLFLAITLWAAAAAEQRPAPPPTAHQRTAPAAQTAPPSDGCTDRSCDSGETGKIGNWRGQVPVSRARRRGRHGRPYGCHSTQRRRDPDGKDGGSDCGGESPPNQRRGQTACGGESRQGVGGRK